MTAAPSVPLPNPTNQPPGLVQNGRTECPVDAVLQLYPADRRRRCANGDRDHQALVNTEHIPWLVATVHPVAGLSSVSSRIWYSGDAACPHATLASSSPRQSPNKEQERVVLQTAVETRLIGREKPALKIANAQATYGHGSASCSLLSA